MLTQNPMMAGRPSPEQMKSAIDQAKRHIQTQKEVADLLAEKIEARVAQRRADARFAQAEINHMQYEHEGLLKAIEQAEKEIAKVENPSPIAQAAPRVVMP